MPEPAAIVSMLSMSPKILKSVAASFQAQAASVNPENLVRRARNVALDEAVRLLPWCVSVHIEWWFQRFCSF